MFQHLVLTEVAGFKILPLFIVINSWQNESQFKILLPERLILNTIN